MYICTTLTFNFSKIKIPDFGIFGDFNETEGVQLRVSNETEAFTEQNITLGCGKKSLPILNADVL